MSNISWLSAQDFDFPDVNRALKQPNGLLALGGDLGNERLLSAYSNGIFPWYEEGQPILWWSPNPRSVLFPQHLHTSKSLKKLMNKGIFQVTFNQAFNTVMGHCARDGTDKGTWITPDIKQAYTDLFHMGIAHSAETWRNGELVGGLYGLTMGKVFFGESMFSLEANASKVAFASMVDKLIADGFILIDCQVHSRHLASLGAREIPRKQFIALLRDAISDPRHSNWRDKSDE